MPKQTTPSCTQQLTDPGQSVKPAKQYRCILQGAQESGKSTFVKHFLSLKKEDPRQVLLDQEEHKQQIAVIIHSAINILCEQLSTKELESMGKNPELLNAMHRVQMIKTVSLDALFENADDIKALWECNGIQACYNRRNEFQFEDNYFASNFVSQVHNFMDTSYLLTDEDIKSIYPDRAIGIKECSGVVENVTLVCENEMLQQILLTGNYSNNILFIFQIDLGGRRSERRKWIHCFEHLSFILFLAAVSEYDQVLEEDGKTNRLEESLHLFKTFLESVYFVEQEVILILTKTDLLKEKLRGGQSPFKKHFPTINGQFPR